MIGHGQRPPADSYGQRPEADGIRHQTVSLRPPAYCSARARQLRRGSSPLKVRVRHEICWLAFLQLTIHASFDRVDTKLLEEVQEYDAVPSEAASYGKNAFWDERFSTCRHQPVVCLLMCPAATNNSVHESAASIYLRSSPILTCSQKYPEPRENISPQKNTSVTLRSHGLTILKRMDSDFALLKDLFALVNFVH